MNLIIEWIEICLFDAEQDDFSQAHRLYLPPPRVRVNLGATLMIFSSFLLFSTVFLNCRILREP